MYNKFTFLLFTCSVADSLKIVWLSDVLVKGTVIALCVYINTLVLGVQSGDGMFKYGLGSVNYLGSVLILSIFTF